VILILLVFKTALKAFIVPLPWQLKRPLLQNLFRYLLAPSARIGHTAVWTGSEMIVWGGQNGVGSFSDTFSYTPGRVMFLYQRP